MQCVARKMCTAASRQHACTMVGAPQQRVSHLVLVYAPHVLEGFGCHHEGLLVPTRAIANAIPSRKSQINELYILIKRTQSATHQGSISESECCLPIGHPRNRALCTRRCVLTKSSVRVSTACDCAPTPTQFSTVCRSAHWFLQVHWRGCDLEARAGQCTNERTPCNRVAVCVRFINLLMI